MPKRKKLSGDEVSDDQSDVSDDEMKKNDLKPVKTSERIRAKRLQTEAVGQKWSAISAAFNRYDTDIDMDVSHSANTSNYGDDNTNDDQMTTFSDPEDADSNPQWQLFEAIRTATNSHGTTFSDPFMRLPSRRFYPDYYKEIKHPMSLAKIRAKIKVCSS